MQPAHKAHQPSRGSPTIFRGRGRGGGRGSSSTPANPSQLSHGQTPRGASSQTFRGSRGRGSNQARGSLSKRFNSQPNPTALPVLPIDISPEAIKPHNSEKIAARREKLKEQYETFRQTAIKNGLMSDDSQSSIDDAIKTRGTCTQMCDEKERVERIFNGSVASEEMLPSPETGHMVTIEGRMVKAFRRSAAGVDKQIPEELRTPRTLRKTLDYLFTNVIGSSDHLGKHHKFVWDRTRAVRNDFSIQSFTRPEDVRYEVDCYERIVRFHILSLHQLANPDQLHPGEEYTRQQELQQLQKTFASLMDRYDTFGHNTYFRNEAEFRAYFILFAARTDLYDFEVQIQQWPKHVLNDGRVQTALKLNAAAGSTDYQVGSRSLEPIPCSVAQANAGLYWTLLASQQVGYLMACVAEISFQLVRFTALDSLWRSAKSAPEKGQSGMRSWTMQAITEYLGFDNEDQTQEFCSQFDISFTTNSSTGQQYLDFRSNPESSLDKPKFNPEESSSQIFSVIVEHKRHGRSFVAVLNGMSVVAASRAGMVIEEQEAQQEPAFVRNSMFVQDDEEDEQELDQSTSAAVTNPPSLFNPEATSFVPTKTLIPSEQTEPAWMMNFGRQRSPDLKSPGGPPPGLFGRQKGSPSFDAAPSVQTRLQNKEPDTFKSTFGGQGFDPISSSPKASPVLTSSIQTPSSSFFNHLAVPAKEPTLASQLTKDKVFTFDRADSFSTSEPSKPFFNFAASTPKSTVSSQAPPSSFLNISKAPSGSSATSVNQSTSSETLELAPSVSTSADSQTNKPFNFSFAAASTLPAVSNSQLNLPSLLPQQPLLPGVQSTNIDGVVSGSKLETQSPVKRASVGDSNFPQFFRKPSETQNTANESSLAHQSNTSELSQASLTNLSSQSPPIPQINSGSLKQQTQLPDAEAEPVDTEKLLEHLCRVGLVQKDGILDMFVSLQVSKIVQDVFQTFQKRRFAQKLSALKTQILRRKYFMQWKLLVDRRRMRRRADKRRKMLIANVQKEQQRKKQKEADLAEIMEADRLTKKMQEEQRLRQDFEQERTATAQSPTKLPAENTPQQVGQKRKTLAHSTSRSNIQSVSISPMHKRSKTIEPSVGTDIVIRTPPSSAKIPHTSFTGSTDLRRSISQKNLRHSLTQQRLDQTQTDYFRLKAIGIDPETPLIPDTAASLAAKQHREAEHHEQALKRIKTRPSSAIDRSRTSTPASPVSEKRAPSLPRSMPVLQLSSQSQKPNTPVEEDAFLKSLREAREAMSSDANWFKAQACELEKEIEQREDFRRSQGSNSSRDDSFAVSTNGFARSLSGYEYVPPDLKSGQTLSRTEERIRRTGARGLANKPIGGTPTSSPRPDYAAVAMSRKTASSLRYSQDVFQETNGGSHSTKRSFDDAVRIHKDNGTGQHHQYANYEIAQQTAKKARNEISVQDLEHPRQNPFDSRLHQHGEDEETEEEEGLEEEAYEDEEAEPAQNGIMYTDADPEGEYEEYYEEDVDDAEDEEEFENEEVEEDTNTHRYMHSQYPRPGYSWKQASEDYETEEEDSDDNSASASGVKLSILHQEHGSQAISAAATPDTGLGSTVDDAIELSD